MGRRGILSNMPKMVLPTVSWVALMSLLKKAPKNLSAFGPGIGVDMAMKALLGCRAAPQTDSLRYADDYFAHVKGPHGSAGKRMKPAAKRPSIMGSCSSRPHTDSFRVHHVVNQEALQLMLTFGDGDADADFEQEAFFEAQELCYGIIRDGDCLLHDDIYADDSTQASSSMRTCSSSLSTAASRSLTSSACITWSRSSVDSEGFYSTATSASFGHASSFTDQLLNVGPHVSCDSRPSSNSMASSWGGASELVYSNVSLDHDLILEAGGEVEEESEPEEEEHLAAHNAEVDADHRNFCAQDDQNNSQTSTSGAAEYGIRKVGHKSYEGDDELVSYEGDADKEEEELEIVAEMCYSENPLEDFAEAISRIVVKQQLNEAAQLQELLSRFLRLNAPRHHYTITLAFLHALQRLAIASVEPHFLHTLL